MKLKCKIGSLVVILGFLTIPNSAVAQFNIGNMLNEAQKNLQQNTTNVPNPLQVPTPASPNAKPVQNSEPTINNGQGTEAKVAATPKVVEQRKCEELPTQGKWTWDVKGIRLGISEDQLTCILPSLVPETGYNEKYRPWGMRTLNCLSNCGFSIGDKQFRQLTAVFIKGELSVMSFIYMIQGDTFDLQFTRNAIQVYTEKFGTPKAKGSDEAIWVDKFQIFKVTDHVFILGTSTAAATATQAQKEAELAEKMQKDKAKRENAKSQVNQF